MPTPLSRCRTFTAIGFEGGQLEVTAFGTHPFVVVQVAPEKVQD
jgi:hypothetical protein